MIFDFKKRHKQKQQEINVREVFNIWDVLKSKYDAREKLTMWYQFAHDKDLKYILNNIRQEFKKNINILEDILNEYSIQGPEQGRPSSNWCGNSEPFRDELIAQDTLFYMQEHIENMLYSSRTSLTNDKVRNTINNMLFKTITEVNSLYNYLRVKGWIDTAPLYPNVPASAEEKISCAEVHHIWDNLTYRYDNIRQTKTFLNLAHDKDFILLLKRGVNILEDQMMKLEKECKKFGITLPKRPAKVFNTPENTELYNDDQMYRIILIGQQGAAIMRVKSIKQCTYNDRIRGIFINMLKEEVRYFERFLRYGKMKGWLNPVPRFKI